MSLLVRSAIGGVLGVGGPLLAGPLSVSELNYNDPEGGDYDFIELVNTGVSAFPLAGVRITEGVTYTFGATAPLDPGARIVVVRARAKFIARYGSGVRLADGSFSGGFSAAGEAVTLVSASGETLVQFTYAPDGRWPTRPNGHGSTLECVDPSGNLNDPANWRPSSEWLGSPGRAGAGPLRRVAINEMLAHTDPPYEDAVELLNLTDESLRMDGWYLSNDQAEPTKYRIPDNTLLGPRGRRVFYQYQFDPTTPPAGRKAFRFNSAHGDDAVLLSADSSGRPLSWMDVVHFGATANGVSLGRHPEGTGPLVPQRRQTFGTEITPGMPAAFLNEFRTGGGAPNAGPLVGPVVFSRIQYQPAPGADEFIELRCIAPVTVPLQDPNHPWNTWRLRDGVDFDFPPGVSLAPDSRLLVVGIDPALFRARHSVAANIPIFGPWTNSLADGGASLVLLKPDPPQQPPHPDAGFVPYVLVEEIQYAPTAPWPPGAAGLGAALRRVNVAAYGNDPANWEAETVAPLTPPVVSLRIQGAQVQLRFIAQPGRTYRLQGRAISGESTWEELGLIPAPAEAGPVILDLTPVGTSRLLRIIAE